MEALPTINTAASKVPIMCFIVFTSSSPDITNKTMTYRFHAEGGV
jgi:hypothetical protein